MIITPIYKDCKKIAIFLKQGVDIAETLHYNQSCKNGLQNFCNSLHNLSHFQFMEGNFSKKGERHEQTQRLSGHVRADPEEYGEQAGYFFAVIQQQRNRQDPI